MLPSFGTISRRQLGRRRVPEDAIAILKSGGIDDWSAAEALGGWLRSRPRSSAILLCAEFHSGRIRAVLDEVLDPAVAERVRVMPLPDRRFDRTNWWTSRGGIRDLGVNWLVRLQGWLEGPHASPPCENADDYSRGVIKAWREEAP